MSEEIAQEIASVRFTPVRMREGYDKGDVDRFLARLGGQPLPERGESAGVIEERPGLLARLFRRP